MMFHALWKVSIKSRILKGVTSRSLLRLSVAILVAVITNQSVAFSQQSQSNSPSDRQWSVLFHSHGAIPGESEWNWDNVVALQNAARESGIDAVILTEQLVAEWTWGPPVIRELWGYRRRIPSIKSYGIEEFFSKVDEADKLVPDITLLAGAEVSSYHYWTGAPWTKNLWMWNWQRNLLVLGLSDPSAFGELPVLGLRQSLLQSWRDVLWLGILLALIVLFLYALNHLYYLRMLILLVPIAMLIWTGPPPPGPYSPYVDDAGSKPYQTVIDTVDAWGGLAIWSMVETIDHQVYPWGGIHTEPHPEVLIETSNYHGFGVLYPDNRTAQLPGHEWDIALQSYLDGTRRNPPWGWGEQALHYPKQVIEDGKQVWHNMTVLLAPDRSRESLLEAFRRGRGYAVHGQKVGNRLRLDLFVAISGAESAGMGEWLNADSRPTIKAIVGFTGSDPQEVTAQLISNGRVVKSMISVPPFELEWVPAEEEMESRSFVRLQVEGRGHMLYSNPIFFEYTPPPDNGDSP